ncbi:MAG TPA: helix-turn-helix transcriptional regulator [Burkholderiales bacterium]|nr:helix-turn-helix transcriptional regulator [Burkholderiales bacterium]
MDDAPDLPRVAGLLADPARAKILWSLIGGTTRPAGELAWCANISAQSASGHLAKLVRGGLLAAEVQGRHRYFRIANAEVASAIEALASLGVSSRPRLPRPPLPSPGVPAQFLHCRTCYGHLAGETAVKVLEGMLKARWLAADGRDFAVTRLGERKLEALGVDLAAARSSRRVFARACVDLTERRAHLGGALGDALLQLYVSRGWIQRNRRSRVVSITPRGREKFRELFGA